MHVQHVDGPCAPLICAAGFCGLRWQFFFNPMSFFVCDVRLYEFTRPWICKCVPVYKKLKNIFLNMNRQCFNRDSYLSGARVSFLLDTDSGWSCGFV